MTTKYIPKIGDRVRPSLENEGIVETVKYNLVWLTDGRCFGFDCLQKTTMTETDIKIKINNKTIESEFFKKGAECMIERTMAVLHKHDASLALIDDFMSISYAEYL